MTRQIVVCLCRAEDRAIKDMIALQLMMILDVEETEAKSMLTRSNLLELKSTDHEFEEQLKSWLMSKNKEQLSDIAEEFHKPRLQDLLDEWKERKMSTNHEEVMSPKQDGKSPTRRSTSMKFSFKAFSFGGGQKSQ